MKKPNDDLRRYAKDNNVLLWQLADSLQIADTTLSKELRHELAPKRKEEMYAQIREIASANKTDN